MTQKIRKLLDITAYLRVSRFEFYLKIKRGEFPPAAELGGNARNCLESPIDGDLRDRVTCPHVGGASCK